MSVLPKGYVQSIDKVGGLLTTSSYANQSAAECGTPALHLHNFLLTYPLVTWQFFRDKASDSFIFTSLALLSASPGKSWQSKILVDSGCNQLIPVALP